jgi:translocation and assembly module TamB
MRVYVDMLGLFSQDLRIRRLTVKEPHLTADKKRLESILDFMRRKTGENEEKKFGVSIKNIKITDGEFVLSDQEKNMTVSGKGLDLGLVIKKAINAEFSLKNGNLKLSDLQQLRAGMNGKFKVEGKRISILGAEIHSSGSTLKTKGEMHLSKEGTAEHGHLTGKANILFKTIGELFALKEAHDGALSFSGSIKLVPEQAGENTILPTMVELDLKTKGSFYLETLMELLKVKQNITGLLSINGRISGVYPRIIGDGVAKLDNAVLGTFPLDSLEGKIRYKEQTFSLKNFIAHTYRGELKGDALLTVPSGGFSVDAHATGLDSRKFFKFIKWEPPFPEGKISGPFTLNKKPGRKIDITASLAYMNTAKKIKTVLTDRLKTVEARIGLKEGILSIHESKLSTASSHFFINGDIDFNQKSMQLNLDLNSDNIKNLSAPYFTGLQAPGAFSGRIEGSTQNPQISGDIKIGKGHIKGEPFSEISGYVQYRPELLSISSFQMVQNKSVYEASGSIAFNGAKSLFSFKNPYFHGNAEIKNGDVQSFISALYHEMPIHGSVDGKVSFDGNREEFTGNADIVVTEGTVYGQPYDRALVKTNLSQKGIDFSRVEVMRNESKLQGEGSLQFDKSFHAKVLSSNIILKDIAIANTYPVDGILQLDIEGSGSIQSPQVKFSVKIKESSLQDFPVGKGVIDGELKKNSLTVTANFLEGTALADAAMELTDTLPWNANVHFKKGRYDFLLAAFLKDIPQDLTASLEGDVVLKGKGKKVTMESKFRSLNFGLYGYHFRNRDNVVIDLKDDTVEVQSFSLVGKNANIKAGGTIQIGNAYDFVLYGRVNFAPLRALSQMFESLNGESDFIIEVTGPWQLPELRGEINVKNATTLLEWFPHKIGPVNGNIFLDKNKLTFKSFHADFAGGKVMLSGTGMLEGMNLKNMLITSELKDISLKPIEDVDVTFDGELFFESSPKKQSIIGDLNIKKARYNKRVEWKSWILRLKRIKDVPFKKSYFSGDTLLNIHVTGKDNVFIDNNIARTPVDINLNIQGTLSRYGLVGRAKTKGGKIFFRNNEFDIIEGNVDFVELNRIIPVFHILAEAFISGYRIQLNLDGPADKFSLSFYSDPPLSDTEILTLLTAGHIREEEKGFESGIGAGEATAFLTGKLQDVFEERFKYFTGFDRFEVNPQTTSTGAVSPRVTVGKRFLEQKLYVTYSSSLGTTEEDIIRLQFDLTRKLSLIGVRDEIGSLGADVKYRYEFK